jgi:isopenicillin N synthase-like dioxygenase
MHRVVNPPPANGSELKSNRRQSIAFFLCINYDTLVECIESCQSKDNPAKYEPILAGAHLLQKHEAAQGRK